MIRYFFNSRNRPVDLSYLEPGRAPVERSGLVFLKDTIRIYPSGRTPENSIAFKNSIGNKGIAAMLPDDYIPSMR